VIDLKFKKKPAANFLFTQAFAPFNLFSIFALWFCSALLFREFNGSHFIYSSFRFPFFISDGNDVCWDMTRACQLGHLRVWESRNEFLDGYGNTLGFDEFHSAGVQIYVELTDHNQMMSLWFGSSLIPSALHYLYIVSSSAFLSTTPTQSPPNLTL